MIHAFTRFFRLTRRRVSALAVLGALTGSACNDNTDPLASNEPSDPVAPPVALSDSVSALDTLSVASASTSGIPFGPFGLWSSYSTVYWGPKPLTNSQVCVSASGIVTLINTARLKGQVLVLQMTCGAPSNYMTDGKFDLAKWKKKMNTFNTSGIRSAIAAGVRDGTIAGNSMIDEPETKRWNNSVTKAKLDAAAGYGKSLFPSLPMGVSHGSTGYKWRSTERYYKVDYVNYQYVSWAGTPSTYRDAVLSRSRHDGVATSFSINILGGGIRDSDNDGNWECPQPKTEGKGSYYPLCRSTADQLRTWGRTLGPAGCMLLLWKYDGTYFNRSDNQSALRDVASTLASKSRRSCRRP